VMQTVDQMDLMMNLQLVKSRARMMASMRALSSAPLKERYSNQLMVY